MLDILNTWRAEIDADLADTMAELADAEAAVLNAEDAARLGRLERRALAETFAQLHPGTVVANALNGRKLVREDELHRLDGELTLRRMRLENVRRRAADLRLAVEQIGILAPAPEAAEHEAVAA